MANLSQNSHTLPLCLALLTLFAGPMFGLDRRDDQAFLRSREFHESRLAIPTSNIAADDLPEAASRVNLANRLALLYGRRLHLFIDRRSGTTTSVLGAIPILPGTGNSLTLRDTARSLGRTVESLDATTVEAIMREFFVTNRGLLGIDPAQLGPVHAAQVAGYLWHVSAPQQVDGIPVRFSRLVATINHGNIVALGTDTWANAALSTMPTISRDDALAVGFVHAGGRQPQDRIVRRPHLEIVPEVGQTSSQALFGGGYDHLLAWTFDFTRPPERARWRVTVDASNGKVLAFEDTNMYSTEQITGGVYPLTATGRCPSNDRCGAMQPDYPMPFAFTGLPAPDDVTDSAGLFDYSTGTVATTLSGPYLRISDMCGATYETGAGSIDLGGRNNDHDCTSSGSSAGDTPAARTAFYETNKLMEMARGWLPGNGWLRSQLQCNVNINDTCNAYWNGTINFFKSGNGCRNTGEVAAVFDHEWGHGLDANDSGGFYSNASEAYADVAAIFRLHASCVGYGFFATKNFGCGKTSDGTGYNYNEDQVGGSHCDTNCSGVRDADWYRHSDRKPDTPQNHVCQRCKSGSGPCGREVHCAAAPVRQAAWDLVTRDLRNAPYSYDETTAFIVGNKLFYHGSGNVGNWHSCDCAAGTSDGCGASSGYIQWLAADDDNGDLADGTPHMKAIHKAFARHGIACDSLTPIDSGCDQGPDLAPVLTANPGHHRALLAWSKVPGASWYWVFRSEGQAGCNIGKALVAWASGTSYTDTGLANGREYHYTIIPAGSNYACYGPASACLPVTPAPLPSIGYQEGSAHQTADTGDNDGYPDNCEEVTVEVTINNDGVGPVTNARVSAISANLSGVRIRTPLPISVGALPEGAAAQVSFTYSLLGANCGEAIDFDVTLEADETSHPSYGSLSFTAEQDMLPVPSVRYSFEGQMDGWTVASGSFYPFDLFGGADGSYALASSRFLPNQCDAVQSPTFVPTATTTLSLATLYDIEDCGYYCYDRANVGVATETGRTVLYPQWGRLYNAGGPNGSCQTTGQDGWAWWYNWWEYSGGFDLTPWAGKTVRLDVRYGTDEYDSGGGIRFDDVRLTDVLVPGCDTQPDHCPPPPVPDGTNGSAPVQAARSGTTIAIDFDTSHCLATDYNLLYGDLADVASLSLRGSVCGLGTDGSYDWRSPPSESLFFLIVGTDGAGRESSWGKDSRGNQRHGAVPSNQCGSSTKETNTGC